MMPVFVLIILMTGHGLGSGAHTLTVPFASYAACELAAQTIKATPKNGNLVFVGCFATGEKQ